MKLFFHINIGHTQGFIPDAVAIVKEKVEDVVVYDVDQDSEILVVQMGIKAIEEADRLFINIHSKAGVSPGNTLKVVKTLATPSVKAKLLVNHTGDNAQLLKLENVLKPHLIKESDLKELAAKVGQFFKES